MTTPHLRKLIGPSPLRLGLLLIPLLLGCIGLLPRAQGVVPAPDGGYPGFNTAEGQNALFSLTSGIWNTALGGQALYHNTTGYSNTAVGLSALFRNNGYENVAIGVAALQNNTTGFQNTSGGYQSLYYSTGSRNTAYGYRSLLSNSGQYNTAIGWNTLARTTSGSDNIALGVVRTGTFGHTGAGENNTTEFNTICIGHPGGLGSGTIAIGLSAFSTPGGNIPVHTRTFIAGIRGVTTGNANALPVVIDSDGQLGTMSSSRRFKDEIETMAQSSETILGLKPVTLHYKSDNTKTPQFGLIAEEVAAVNPDLVVRDEKGEIYSVRYDAVNAMLLNEFLKEHRKNEEQEVTISRQQKQIEALTAGLQKVSAQLEASKPAPQVVNNP